MFRKESVAIESGTKCIHKGIHGESNVFYYLFEYIYPFYNGNGRMGRFIASGYLSKYFNIYCSLQLSIACKYKKKEYYDAFELANDVRNESDLTPFILSFLKIYLSDLTELKDYIENTFNNYKHIKEIYIEEDNISLLYCLLEVTIWNDRFNDETVV